MSIFRRLFGIKTVDPRQDEQAPIERDVAALVAPLAKPAVHLCLSDEPGRSHVGGQPRLPSGTRWPSNKGVPLGFLASLSLAEIHDTLSIDWLPRSGALLFFYDLKEQSSGSDPADKGWAVLHVEDSDEPAPVQDIPPADGPCIPFRWLSLHAITSLPTCEHDSLNPLLLTGAEFDELDRLKDLSFKDLPKHQLGGHPSPVQGDDMELEAQLASHGLFCGNGRGYADPRAAELRIGATDWRLLLQFDTDDELDVMWGDVGTLYFWIPEAAARAGDFDKTWLILQCC